jgi:hypothetical protein
MTRALVTVFCFVAVLAPTMASAASGPQLDQSAQSACFEVAFYNGQKPGSSGRRSAVAYMAQVLQRSESNGARVLARRLRAAHSPSARQSAVAAVTRFCVAGGHPPGPPFFLPK